MKTIEVSAQKYEVLLDYRDGLNLEDLEEKLTDYFKEYDYVIGDWAYNKLRLKGFYDKGNKKVNSLNSFENKALYLNENCAYDCRYFIIKKI